ncbi:MAG: flavodoxin domain-containing protein, partial [Myxococcota bacterium]|nr:flavodoxin domain-containing protein [Myxococcota bacterium]
MIQIAFASETGNTTELAELTFTRLSSLGFPCELDELDRLDLSTLPDRRLFLLLTSTFGDGEPPANGEDFFDALMANSAPRLDQLTFSVCALGDSSYELFCQCGKDFDRRLAELGARRIVPRVDCDVGEEEDRWEGWLTRITEQIPAIMATEERAPRRTAQLQGEAPSLPDLSSSPLAQPPSRAQQIPAPAASPSRVLEQQGSGSGRAIGGEGETRVGASPRSPTPTLITRKNPFFARIIRNDNLNNP